MDRIHVVCFWFLECLRLFFTVSFLLAYKHASITYEKEVSYTQTIGVQLNDLSEGDQIHVIDN